MNKSLSPLSSLPLSDNKEEGSNAAELSDKPSNKRSKNQKLVNKEIKKVKTLEKIEKYKSWIWNWCNPVLLNNENTDGECGVKITDEKICGKVYLSRNSISNLITHLSEVYQITENTKVEGRAVSRWKLIYLIIIKNN